MLRGMMGRICATGDSVGMAVFSLLAFAAWIGCAQTSSQGFITDRTINIKPPPAQAEDPRARSDGEPEPVPAIERPPATEAAQKVVDTIKLIEQSLTSTIYQHKTVVDVEKGIFHWDCSGMVAWILGKAAPKAHKALGKKHPPAKDYYNLIAGSPADGSDKGWQRLEKPDDISPGDVFAWLKPSFWEHHKNTGHVGFVIGTPQPHPYYQDVLVMRIADATRMVHEDDSRVEGGEGGFGTATMAFRFDGNGKPAAYGWYGIDQSLPTYVPTDIIFGRVTE